MIKWFPACVMSLAERRRAHQGGGTRRATGYSCGVPRRCARRFFCRLVAKPAKVRPVEVQTKIAALERKLV